MKKFIYFTLIIFISFFLNSPSDSQTTVSIRLGSSTGEDCLVASNFPNTSFPEHPDLAGLAGTVEGYYYAGRSYFKFDLSGFPTNSTVLNAKLSLYANPNPSNGNHDGENKSYLRKIVSPWSASTTTFDNQPDFTYLNQIPLETSASPYQDYTDIDVTTLVSQMISDPVHNYGFLLALRLEGVYRAMNFASSECADINKRPLLVITFDEPLPVEMISFNSIVNGRNCDLKWTTSQESNNSGFEIYRSADQDNSSFIRIGFVEGAGNTSVSHNYLFEDKNLNTGRYKYRIKQIDFNGNFKMFDLLNNVIIGIPEKYSISQNYPNPFNPVTKINYDLISDGNVSIILYDISGREVKKLVNEFRSAGYYSLELNAAELSSGSYFYKIISENFTDTKSMMLIK